MKSRKNKQYVTIYDIAKQARVSAMTVSRALRNAKDVSPKTRMRILEIAERLNYRMNPMVSALMKQVSEGKVAEPAHLPLAFLCHYPTRKAFFALAHQNESLLQAAEKKAESLGYYLEWFFYKKEKLNPQRLTKILLNRGIKGVLFSAHATEPAPFDYRQFACIAFGANQTHHNITSFCGDHFREMQKVTQKVHALGYRKIGLAVPRALDQRMDHAWAYGYRSVIDELAITEAQKIPMHRELLSHDHKHAFQSWYEKYRPDVIIARNYILNLLPHLPYKVPKDFALALISVPPDKKFYAGILGNEEFAADHMIEYLVNLVERNRIGPPKIPITVTNQGRWHSGKSLPPYSRKTSRSSLS